MFVLSSSDVSSIAYRSTSLFSASVASIKAVVCLAKSMASCICSTVVTATSRKSLVDVAAFAFALADSGVEDAAIFFSESCSSTVASMSAFIVVVVSLSEEIDAVLLDREPFDDRDLGECGSLPAP